MISAIQRALDCSMAQQLVAMGGPRSLGPTKKGEKFGVQKMGQNGRYVSKNATLPKTEGHGLPIQNMNVLGYISSLIPFLDTKSKQNLLFFNGF